MVSSCSQTALLDLKKFLILSVRQVVQLVFMKGILALRRDKERDDHCEDFLFGFFMWCGGCAKSWQVTDKYLIFEPRTSTHYKADNNQVE